MAQSRKFERFRRKPAKKTDPSVEEWIEDAKTTSDSKGLTKEQTALRNDFKERTDTTRNADVFIGACIY